jgi:hypothetical protein
MADYGTEPHPDHGDVMLVTRLPEPGEQYGRVIGWCTGPAAADCAEWVAAWIRGHHVQPPARICERLHYTPKEGEEP